METNTRRAALIWAVAVLAYVTAVLQRTSFGVAGIDAAARYHVSSGVLAGFAVLQLLMYAGLQVPVGVALDRFGSRRLIVAGALVMAAGQLVLAVSTSVPATPPPSSRCSGWSLPGSRPGGYRC